MPRKPVLPAILMLQEKHDTHLFYIPDEETLHKAALEILAKRDKTGYYYTSRESEPAKLDFSEEDIAKMPASMQKDARAKFQRYKAESRAYQQEQDNLRLIKEAIKAKNGEIAWTILKDVRGDYEYEGVRLVQPVQLGGYIA